jgi:hypothetical protein
MQQENESEPQPVTLYMHGAGDPAELQPVFPSNGSGNSAPPARYGGINAPRGWAWLVGNWVTQPVSTAMTIGTPISGKLWAKGSGQDVLFYINVFHNNNEIRQLQTESKSVSGDTEFTFSGDIPEVEMAPEDTFSIRIYGGSRYGSSYELAWGSITYDSHVQISCNSIFVEVNAPVIGESIVTFSATVFDAFNSPALEADILVRSMVDAVSLSEPRFTLGGNGSLVAWDWDYKTDKAKSGEYTITVMICYGDENEFMALGTFNIEFPQGEKEDGIMGSIGSFLPIIIIVVIAVVAVVIVKVVLNKRAEQSSA